ncbi:hypothetical protein [Pseudoponticoccus marisrubri]|uniref:Uncharacterized protein n=1 Tax=Pseudoponticoccus marisrubri TaxID=1685382 RepID=A0A0W7WJ86_9RHOB|nr:hypothetical protein [Pseudoponticoccus marisrubri]KUF10688.1 hypothetical protein AVJ23_11265 [Pseudoponticoccus marisrubri]
MQNAGRAALALICLVFLSGRAALAEPVSVFLSAAAAGRAPLVDLSGAPAASTQASLFSGRGAGSLFAPVQPRAPASQGLRATLASGDPVARLRSLIASAEAGAKGYDAVQYGATRRPDRPPTAMTIGEIYEWIRETPGQPHAIGRYQFIPPTLRRLVRAEGLSTTARFSPAVQDRLADRLLAEAGMAAFRGGTLSRHAFMHNLSKIWAGLPTASGKSYYHGYAGNKATMSWDRFDREMARIFPG